ncbi:C-X-C chemokine receptor type 2 [Gadus morhua]|uniref:C-X-C chemokine receptor type 2-like n=1 Tax=Gadus morhua TaxID=8049 RepID=A0A8C5CLW8_GADMO|nr:C-X-C chemokine receptor type 2-like [Gadus morhua]
MNNVFNFEDYYYDTNSTIINTTFVPAPNTLSCNVEISPTVARLLCFTYIVIFHMAVSGNILVGLVICVNWRVLTPSDVYLFHLTIADFLLALTLPFWATKAGFQTWIFGDFMCKLVSLITEANFYTSILFLVCISIDRYLTIVCAASTRVYRQRYCSRFACASIWALGVLLALPALVKEALVLTTEKVACAEPLFGNSMWKVATRVLRHVVGFLLPLVVMVTCYGITIARLLRTRSFKKHRAMRVIMAVVGAFLLCWMPYHLAVITDTLMRIGLLEYDCTARMAADTAERVTLSLALAHCCINPVLYAIVGEKFWGNLAKIRIHRDVMVSRSRYSRSTSQTSEGNGPVF